MKVLLLEVPLLLLAAALYWQDRRLRSRGRRSPLNENLLRTPGYSARKRQLEKGSDVILQLFGVAVVPYLVAAAMTESVALNWIIGVMGLLLVAYCFYRAVKLFGLVIRLHLGVDAELAVGQELNYLMRDGAWVYHDIPYPYGNIDHVVIGTGGIFAIETKGVSKPVDPSRSGAENATLTVKEGTLIMPHSKTNRPIKQAKAHAQWLRQEIKRRFELSVPVQAVVAIPGWMINGGFDEDCWVINPKRGNALRNSVIQSKIDTQSVSIVAAWVEDLARSVSPRSKEFDAKSEMAS